jgi:predicted PurR-regulated permease PerM
LLSSPLKAIGTVAVYILIQQIESTLIAPKIMSENVGLHPIVIIFSILAGAELFGVWGLLFAIPLAGILKVVLELVLEMLTPLNKELD